MPGFTLLSVFLCLGLVGAVHCYLEPEYPPDFDPKYPEEVPGMFQGDIDLDGHSPFGRNAVGNSNRRWPGARIPIKIHSYLKDFVKEVVITSMTYIQEKTSLNGRDCITFVNHTDEENYVFVATGVGCHSNIGYKGKPQGIFLGIGCRVKGITVHEMLHTVGFYHEQSRPDRDHYVKINMTNVKEKMGGNFLKLYPPLVSTQGLPYDYNSIMHYNAYEFAIDRSIPTIIPLKKGVEIGQRIGMSQLDIIRVQRLYGCPERKRIVLQDADVVTPNCTFDGGLCGWTHVEIAPHLKNNTWIRLNDETSSFWTGPSDDHTIGTFEGYYLYSEASSNYHSVARIRTPTLTAGDHCLTYWYHMYGKDMGTLQVNMINDDIISVNLKTISGDQGNQWIQDKISLTATSNTKIEFESTIGDLTRSDIAIDDVIVMDTKC